jgi:hypothetical protein
MSNTMYDDAFDSGHEVLRTGPIDLPTGQVVACDPFFAGIATPFSRTVSPGRYDVELCRSQLPDYGFRIALARIAFSPGARAVTYERAIRVNSDSNLYSVESGVGSFMDESTRQQFVQVMARFYQQNPNGNYYAAALADEFRKSALYPDDPDDPGSWAVHVLRDGGPRIAMFASGLGDGTYESYWGINAANDVVSLITDFRLL